MKPFKIWTIGILFLCLLSSSGFIESGHGEAFKVNNVLTSHEYNATYHIPIYISDFYDISGNGVFLWVNMSYIPEQNLSIVWFYPNNTIFWRDNLSISETSFNNSLCYDAVSYMPIADEKPSKNTGLWRVEVYLGEVIHASHEFNIINKNSDEWGYSAEIITLETPEKVYENENFTVSVTIHYSFEASTLLSPGLWDVTTENLIVETFDEVNGEGTRTYELSAKAVSYTSIYSIEAAAFYLVEGEWFIDDNGLSRFDVKIEKVRTRNTIDYLLIGVVVIGFLFIVLQRMGYIKIQTTDST